MKRISKRASLGYYVGFERLIAKRKELGITPERMEELLSQICEHSDDHLPLSAQEIRELEDDPTHGLRPEAMAYLRFFNAVLGIKQSLGSLPEEMERKRSVSMLKNVAEHAHDMLLLLPEKGDVKGITITFEMDGASGSIWMPMRGDDPAFLRIKGILKEWVVEWVDRKRIADRANRERKRLLRGLAE